MAVLKWMLKLALLPLFLLLIQAQRKWNCC